MASVWRTRPVFISSTFRDMHAERDWLRHHVFPRLEEELRRRYHLLEPIDLRIGVETAQAGSEEARELLVLKVCLDEIKRSRPFLIVLLGDRYGWVPPEDRIAAAANEQGFKTSPSGKSVTALEIEFGILKEDPSQRQRSLFFFRRPLPYDQMPEVVRVNYSDAHSPDPRVRECHTKLNALKARLRYDRELGPCVFDYAAGWDALGHKVTDLEAFGDLVFEKLWAALDEETKVYAGQPAPTWEEQERAALAEFVEHRSRNFTGREELVRQLLAIACSDAAEGTMRGAYVTGLSGSGKSALFAELFRRLEGDPSVLVLANAAGATQRGSSADAMLHRWIAELAAFLAVKDPLPENASVEEVDRVFASLLGQASAKKRVVVLLDALDQFEPTPRARHLTWLPRLWPPDARLIATSLLGMRAESLSQSAGFEEIVLPPLTATGARDIAQRVWKHWHVPWSDAVWQKLAEKRLPDGSTAIGNPLWVTLACEQLAILDADDFALAERQFAGESDPQSRLIGLRRDLAQRMPSNVPGLYEWLLVQTEKVHGEVWARAFAVAIALSRHGWRESDLRGIIPRISGVLFPKHSVADVSPLKLAELRRAFRAHISMCGKAQQWDFFHSQARDAVNRRLQAETPKTSLLHAAIADHLQSRPTDDFFRESELMFHLIQANDPIRAATYYGGGLSAGELVGATDALAERILDSPNQEASPSVAQIVSWLGNERVARTTQLMLCHQFLAQLQTVLVRRGVSSSIRLGLIQAVQRTMPRLRALGRIGMESELWASYGSVGDVMLAEGNVREAGKAYRRALKMAQSKVRLVPMSQGVQYEVAVSWGRLGEVYRSRGDLRRALQAEHNALGMFERLLSHDPTNVDFLHGVGSCRSRIVSVLLGMGHTAEGLNESRECLRLAEQLVERDPANLAWRRELMTSHGQMGVALLASGDVKNALKAHNTALDVADYLVHQDPTNAEYIVRLSLCHASVGKVLQGMGETEPALHSFNEAVRLFEPLAKQNKSDAAMQSDLAHLYIDVAICQKQAGRHDCASDFLSRFDTVVRGMRNAGMHCDEKLLKLLRQSDASLTQKSHSSSKIGKKVWWKLWS